MVSSQFILHRLVFVYINIIASIQNIAVNVVFQHSVDILAPPMVTRSQGSVLSLPIYQNVSYNYFDYVKDVDGVQYPPLLVLLEGTMQFLQSNNS